MNQYKSNVHQSLQFTYAPLVKEGLDFFTRRMQSIEAKQNSDGFMSPEEYWRDMYLNQMNFQTFILENTDVLARLAFIIYKLDHPEIESAHDDYRKLVEEIARKIGLYEYFFRNNEFDADFFALTENIRLCFRFAEMKQDFSLTEIK